MIRKVAMMLCPVMILASQSNALATDKAPASFCASLLEPDRGNALQQDVVVMTKDWKPALRFKYESASCGSRYCAGTVYGSGNKAIHNLRIGMNARIMTNESIAYLREAGYKLPYILLDRTDEGLLKVLVEKSGEPFVLEIPEEHFPWSYRGKDGSAARCMRNDG